MNLSAFVITGAYKLSRVRIDIIHENTDQQLATNTVLPLSWESEQYWGVCFGELRLSNLPPFSAAASAADDVTIASDDVTAAAGDSGPVVLTSYRQDDAREALRAAGFQPERTSGDGYKLLQVSVCACARVFFLLLLLLEP